MLFGGGKKNLDEESEDFFPTPEEPQGEEGIRKDRRGD